MRGPNLDKEERSNPQGSKPIIYAMDTATYAAAAALPPRSVIRSLERPFVPEADFLPFDLSEVARSWYWRFRATGPCNDI